MCKIQYLTVTLNEKGQRLDNYLIRFLKGVPKSYIYRVIRSGEVRINKKRAKAATRLNPGDLLRIPPTRTAPLPSHNVSEKLSKKLQESIIFEDKSLLVINKPTGLAVHGGSGLSLGVIEALRKMRPDIAYLELVHRLDKETSGCLLLAKKRSKLRALQALFTNQAITKVYWVLVEHPWHLKQEVKVITHLKKNTLASGERKVKVASEGKLAETQFTLLEKYTHSSFLKAIPKTGRTHQIRVHAASLNHAVLGDDKYSPKNEYRQILKGTERLYLHAREIQFNLDNTNYKFCAELDNLFLKALEHLRQG